MATYAEYAGNQTMGVFFPFGLGAEPSTCVIRGLPDNLPRIGDLRLVDDSNGTNVIFRDCLFAGVSYDEHIPEYRLLDRRWKWRGGLISMAFNVPVAGGPEINNEMPPQQIASALFNAMGEPNANVSALPNVPRPHVNWESVEPRHALAYLCEMLGCVPGLDPFTNRATIYRYGEGNQNIQSDSLHLPRDYSAGYLPRELAVIFGPTVFQTFFKIEAVVFNAANDLVSIGDGFDPVAADIRNSAAPWAGFPALSDDQPNKAVEYASAKASGYRYYRIVGSDNGLNIPGYGAIQSINQVMPVFNNLAERFDNLIGFPAGAYDPYVIGKFWSYEYCGVTPATEQRYELPFRIHGDAGVVEFQHPVFQTAADGTPEACEVLYLYAAHNIRDANGNLVSHSEVRNLGNTNGAGVHGIRQTGAFRKIINGGAIDNFAALQLHANQILDAAEPRWQARVTRQHRSLGFEGVAPDGNMWQTTWASGSYLPDRIATTILGYNCEPCAFGSSRELLRTLARAKAIAEMEGI